MVLKDFEKKGYVTLEPMQDDRRNKQIIPTLTGKAYAARIISELHELEMSVLCDFGEERLSRMADAFCEIVIWHAAIDKILKLCRRWEREVSLDQKNLNVMLSSPKQ